MSEVYEHSDKENEDVNQKSTINYAPHFLKKMFKQAVIYSIILRECSIKYKNCYITQRVHLCGLSLFRILFYTNEIALATIILSF